MGFRDVLPASLQQIIQDGLLDGVFEDALVPALLFGAIAEVRPWGAQIGTESIMTRNGLMPVSTTPVTGADAPVGAYGFEQYTVKMDQYGDSKDTNMAVSAFALASDFLEDNKVLAINAAQTRNYLARNALYGVYGNGFSWADEASSDSTSLHVVAADGYQYAVVTLSGQSGNDEGLNSADSPSLQAVSSSNPLTVTIGSDSNTVTGVTFDSGTTGPGTLTLGTAATVTKGTDVVSSIAPVSYRPGGGASANDLTSDDIATLATFQNAVTRLRRMNVPRLRGAYTAHVAAETVNELFQDEAFQRVYATRADSAAYRNFQVGDEMGDGGEFMGRFAGIDWILNTVVPGDDTVLTNVGGVPYYRPIVCGAGALIEAPFEKMGDLVSTLNAGSTVEVSMIGGVARILRAPLDRFGQILSSTWSWIGGYTSGTDLLTGDSAAYKRAVVIEHA